MARYNCADGRYIPEGHDMEECPVCLRAQRDDIRQEYRANVNVDLVARLKELERRICQQRKELAELNAKMVGPPAYPTANEAFSRWCMASLDRRERRFAAVSFMSGWQAARRAIGMPESSAAEAYNERVRLLKHAIDRLIDVVDSKDDAAINSALAYARAAYAGVVIQ